MARRRYRRRSYRRKGIWSTRIQNITGSQLASAGNQFVINYDLTQNPAQSAETVSIKYTVKNINLQLELESESSFVANIENLQAYVCFIPQGFIPSDVPGAYANVPFQHPEWILTHRYFGSSQSDANNVAKYPPLRMFSRLARKLDTGDRIVVIILGNNAGTGSATLNYQGLVKYNTKAN